MKRKNKLSLVLFSLVVLLLVSSGCTISHDFGPYMGKVVDKATGDPIEGAVVFIMFDTEGGQFIGLGGGNSVYADAIECLTDNKGEFHVPAHRIIKFRLFHRWQKQVMPIIFKPGYGVFPGNPGVRVSMKNKIKYTLSENDYSIIQLPRLNTIEDRKRNLGNITFVYDVPYEKWRELFEYRNLERIAVGLPSYKNPYKQGK